MPKETVAQTEPIENVQDEKFYSFMGTMPKEYEPFIEGVPSVVRANVSGNYSWQMPRSAYHRNGGETTPERDALLAEELLGKAYDALKTKAQQQGFNALFQVYKVKTEFDEERWQRGLMMGTETIHDIRSCNLTAEALAYHINFEKK